VAPVQLKVLDALKDSDPLSMNDLVSKVQESSETAVTATAVKGAVLPLIAGDRLQLTDDLKLRLRPEAR
jgi:hypothetical protein